MRSRERGKYPLVGIDWGTEFVCNRNMRIVSAVVAFVMLAACHTIRDRPPQFKIPVSDRDVLPESPARAPEARQPEASNAAVVPRSDAVFIDDSGLKADANKRIATVNSQLQDVFYEYDRAKLSDGALKAVQQDAVLLATLLREFPVKVIVEGHCDERGSAEYNLALGDNRAASTAAALRNFGIATTVMETVSYGKEKPQCSDPAEACWEKNRRAHLVIRAISQTQDR